LSFDCPGVASRIGTFLSEDDLYRQKSKYVRQEMTGFVWLDVQK
jgi:hypothetical protein